LITFKFQFIIDFGYQIKAIFLFFPKNVILLMFFDSKSNEINIENIQNKAKYALIQVVLMQNKTFVTLKKDLNNILYNLRNNMKEN
jgi:hypothetical protein